LDLASLAIELGLEDKEYEPEQFPALIYSRGEVAGTFLIFESGKVILTGSSDIEQVSEAFTNLFDRLRLRGSQPR